PMSLPRPGHPPSAREMTRRCSSDVPSNRPSSSSYPDGPPERARSPNDRLPDDAGRREHPDHGQHRDRCDRGADPPSPTATGAQAPRATLTGANGRQSCRAALTSHASSPSTPARAGLPPSSGSGRLTRELGDYPDLPNDMAVKSVNPGGHPQLPGRDRAVSVD